MKCPRCQYANPPGSNFCLGCGTRMGATCGACGNEVPAGARFCNKCGTPISGEPAGQVRFASPESYTPKHLAERILTSKSALEGERKQVTVLFADLKGSMELLADRDPEEARRILDPIIAHMMEAVHRYEGTVNQVMGDGIMALFGAPLAHEDHAVRACYAALRMQEAVKRYAEGVRREGGVMIRIRVGLNSGEVVVGAIASDLHMDYTAVGQTTHLAARMEQLAEPGTAALTPATLALSEDFVQVKSLGPMRVKGLSEAVEAYELIGANPVRSRFQAHAARGLTTFVGRTSEIAQLAEALDVARSGRGQVVAVVGEPGVGKSRLLWEFAHSHRTERCLVIEAASVSYGKATTYLPVIELLRTYFLIEPRDDMRKIREKVTGKLFSLDRALEPALPALLTLLDIQVDDGEWTRLDPVHRRQRTLDAVKGLLLRESQVQPLVVIFEDLHWIDGETQAVIQGLVESLPTARLLLLVNYRPEYQHPWGSKTYYRQLRIDALPAANAEEFLAALLGGDSSLEELKRLLSARTEGNPFFLEESVRTLVETRILVGEPGRYRLTTAPESLQIPATAQAIVAARIDRLEPEDKRLLQSASVVGKDVPLVLLEALADMGEDEMRRGLARLRTAEFLYEMRLFPDVEYTFKHALTHELAYGSLLHDRRRALHARIVEAGERVWADRLSEHVERLAYHAVRGEVWAKAVGYLRQAAAKAMSRSAHREAVGCLEQALEALRHAPAGRKTLECAVDIRFELRTALYPLGEFERTLAYLREAQPLAEALGDDRQLARISAYVCVALRRLGDFEGAIEAGERALSLANAIDDPSLRVATTLYLGQALWSTGAGRRAVEVFRKNVDSLTHDELRQRFGAPGHPGVFSMTDMASALVELGDYAEAKRIAEAGLAVAEELAHPFTSIAAYLAVAHVAAAAGEFATAIARLEQARSLCERGDFPLQRIAAQGRLGYAYLFSQRLADGLALLEEAAQHVDRIDGFWRPELLGWLSEGYLLSGRVGDAAREAERAMAITPRNAPGVRAWMLRLAGDVASHGDHIEAERAAGYYRDAASLAEALELRLVRAHCDLGLGKLYRRTGKREQAREHLTTAATMYREMGMRFWLEQAEAEQRR